MTRVAIIGELRLLRDGLEDAFKREEGIEVVGVASHLQEANALLDDTAPEVVLVDLAMTSPLEMVRALALRESVRVVVIAVPDREDAIVACAEAGIAGLVTRDASLSDLVEAIDNAGRGDLACSPRTAGILLRRLASVVLDHRREPDRRKLTKRESEIARLLAQGLSNKEIAARLSIEVATVKNHVHNILEKLEVPHRGDVAEVFLAASEVRM